MTQEAENPQELATNASLLEDASTLLMFHSVAVQNQHKSPQETKPLLEARPLAVTTPATITPPTATATPATATIQLLPKAEVKHTPSPTVPLKPLLPAPARMAHLTSPGPAIATLSGQDSDENNKSQKAMVAAAALAAAAGIPMPLVGNRTLSVDETLRATIKEKSQTGSEAIANTLQNELTTEHVDALKEMTAEIRKEITENKDVETDTEEQSTEKTVQITTPEKSPVGVKEEEPRLDAMDIDENATTADEKEFNETETEKEEDHVPRVKRQKRTPTPPVLPEGWILDPSAVVITCVCRIDTDDGSTIQCDTCYRWQHLVCMGIKEDQVPEEYYCNVCKPRRIDAKKARSALQRRIENLEKERADITPDTEVKTVDNEETAAAEKDKTQKTKPKPQPELVAYNKNIDESEIFVPEPKNAWKVVFYPLKEFDYQDSVVYNFAQGLVNNQSPKIEFIEQEDLKHYDHPRLKVKSYTDVNSKKFNGITRLGLFTEDSMDAGHIVSDYLGEIGLKERYITDPRNQYRIWGVEKPHVAFVPGTPFVVDSRTSGNNVRYIRRSCHPNCELKAMRTEDTMHFVIKTIRPVSDGTELTLPWNWDPLHPIKNLLEGHTFDSTADADKPILVLSVESILTFVDCGCPSNSSDCYLSKVKKASAHIYRATRKGNSTSGLKLLQPEAPFVPLQERLIVKETADITDALEQVNATPLASVPNALEEAQLMVRPFLYHYLTKRKRTLPQPEVEQNEYLPIPVQLVPDAPKNDEQGGAPVKKRLVSFKDYKKKMKPAPPATGRA